MKRFLAFFFWLPLLVLAQPPAPQNVTLMVDKTTGAIVAPVDAATFASANGLGGGGGGGAPTNAPYITQTPNGTLTNEQALSLLATGLLKSTTSTGVVSIAVAGTDYMTPAGVAAAYQPLDADLTAIAALTTTSFGRSTLTLADAAAGRSYFGVVIGTNVQAWDTDLDTWATKTAPSGMVVGTTDSQTLTNKTYNGVTLTGSSSPTLAVTGTTAVSGTNTGDQTTVTGNAGTATALQTARNINGVSFNGTADITVTASANTLSGTALPALNGAALTALNGSNIASGTVPAAQLGSGSSITTKFLRGDNTWQTVSGGASPLTTKGDLYTFTTVDARLGVGSDGQALIADSSQAAGIKWATLPGGGDALTTSPLSQFASTTSAQFAGVISNETGSGLVVLNNAPTFIAPVLGAATATTINTVGLSGSSTPTLAVTGTTAVSGTNTGDQTSVTGNAGTATALQTARAIYGNNFDGTAALTQIIGAGFGGTGNGFTAFTGPASSTRTFTLPNASATILTDNASVTVAQGGTGRATGTTAYALIATGTTATGAQQTLPAGATTEILVGAGASALPVWTTATGSGAPVRATSPTLVTPALGTPTAIVLTSGTGLPIASGVSGLGAGVATALAVNVGSAGAPVVLNGAGGTPSAINLSNATALPTSAIVTQSTLSGTTPSMTYTAGKKVDLITTSGNTTFSASGYAAGYQYDIIITADATRTLSFPGWVWVEGAPTTIASGKVMWITTYCTSTTAGSVVAAYGVQQ